jgi:hypothetical protein
MSGVLLERDYKNLGDIDATKTKRFVEVVNSDSNPIKIGGLLSGLTFDSISVTYDSAIQETYRYYTGGIAGTLVATLTVIYTDATKNFLNTIERT